MEAAEKFLTEVITSPETHYLIACTEWRQHEWHDPDAVRTKCEGCGVAISAFPVCVEKTKDGMHHLICRFGCMPLALKISKEPIAFGGNVVNNQWPK